MSFEVEVTDAAGVGRWCRARLQCCDGVRGLFPRVAVGENEPFLECVPKDAEAFEPDAESNQAARDSACQPILFGDDGVSHAGGTLDITDDAPEFHRCVVTGEVVAD